MPLNKRLPAWFRQAIPDDNALKLMRRLSDMQVNTVCKEAKCPNIGSCFAQSRMTFMILGNTCTRSCGFCNVNKAAGRKLSLDRRETTRICSVIKDLGLRYAVITSVTRDDLDDGGAGQFAELIKEIRGISADIRIEILIPDLQAKPESIKVIRGAGPDVVGHNLETVPGLYPALRPQADYQRSLSVLRMLKDGGSGLITKSSLMLGFGETPAEVERVMKDLRGVDCDILTLGQYLAPSEGQVRVKEFITPEQFKQFEITGFSLGFKEVLAGPLVRSSFKANELQDRVLNRKKVDKCTI
ncbi:MAG: lipoyl synthase [Candidatus Omnitrophica bacterium]|jgi:lipoic acid synthetase|nr:lipoyl synthase [Candidatus Omnitrophota bacterium]MDD5080102.1 lipoyl synthase [Candidatus Omnitrophota bacterium]